MQSIEWKKDNKPQGTEDLYYQGSCMVANSDNLEIAPEGIINFQTYSNIFNWKKWFMYGQVDNLYLNLNVTGHFKLQVIANSLIIFDKEIICDDNYTLEIPDIYIESIISFKLISIERTLFYSGQWATTSNDAKFKDVKIALVMCTFNRDEYLFRNLEILKENLPECYSVFIVDNGNRIPKYSVESLGPHFKIFHNNNTGGSGGFTRGLVEALRDENEWTHVHFMDDDVTIETESLNRTASFLSLIRDDYKDHFISGAMLRMDTPWIMHESTAAWNGVRIKEFKKGLDLRNTDDILLNEIEERSSNHFAAWWYCVIPLSKEMESDLPFPFFIYGDDIEYSLRRAKGIIALNGVCVWHEPFEKKHSAVMKSYFFCRNLMVLNTLRNDRFTGLHVWKTALINFLVQLFVHDYLSVGLVLETMTDYLKGPDHLMKCSNENLFKEKRKTVPSMIPAGTMNLKGYHAIKLNDKKHKAPIYFFKKRIVAYDYERANMELRIRSFRKIFNLSVRFITLSFQLLLKYKNIKDEFNKINLNISFWDGKNIPA